MKVLDYSVQSKFGLANHSLPFIKITAAKYYKGYINGFKQPAIFLEVKLTLIERNCLIQFKEAIKNYFPSYPDNVDIETSFNVVQFLVMLFVMYKNDLVFQSLMLRR